MTDLVLGFYANQETASEILRTLQKKGFGHSGVISKTHSGESDTLGFIWRVAACFIGVLLLTLFASHYSKPSASTAVIFLGVFIVLIFGWYFRRYRRLNNKIIEQFGRWVLEGEALVIVEVSDGNSHRALQILRNGSGDSPATFSFRQSLGAGEEKTVREPLTSEALREHAIKLARGHQVCLSSGRRQHLLKCLNKSRQALERVRQDLFEAVRLEQRISPAAEWLLDNAYLIHGHIADIRKNLPARYDKELPTLFEKDKESELRVQYLARTIVEKTDSHLSRSNIIEFLQAYQTVSPLTIGELWVFPLMLRFVLIEELGRQALQVNRRQLERQRADFWANRLLAATRHDPNQLLGILGELAREQNDLPPHFAVHLAGHLYDEEAAFVPVQHWLERKLETPLQDLRRQEQTRQAVSQISIANAIGSLKQLAQMDWRDIFETVSCVESVLRQDPAGVYSQSDFATRDRCRRSVEEIARYAKASEVAVARQAILLAEGATIHSDDLFHHVGYYLIADGRIILESEISCHVPWVVQFKRCVQRHPALDYLGSILALTSLLLISLVLSVYGLMRGNGELVLISILAFFPASECSLQIVNIVAAWLESPRVLPKLLFENGIPADYRTLVAVPMMLLTSDSIRQEVEKLEVRYLANPDPQLRYALLSDFTDAPQQNMPQDSELLDIAVRGIEQLNTKYPEHPFFLFHRSRRFCKTQSCWMGWERKRGKVEELNAFLYGEGKEELLLVGEKARLGKVRFVITLDADTQLPHDTARRLVETLAHPLNRPRFSSDRRRVLEGYSIIQPRVSITLPSATITPFTRLFSDPKGTDLYSNVVSDVYQDLFGEGIFHGKAILDVEAFHKLLGGRFPEETLLSHDLIEGTHVRVGYASDIELFEQFPVNYQAYMKRQHRWIRGDWQIAQWVLPVVPTRDGSRQPNPLTFINRWKILDNLRRSLVPAASVVFLVWGWLLFPNSASASLLVGLMLLSSSLARLPMRLLQSLSGTRGGWKEEGREFLRVLVSTALLPHQAFISLDAITRVWYRRFISHCNLLEWESAQVAHWNATSGLSRFVAHMIVVTLGTAILTIALCHRHFNSWFTAFPILTLWMVSPMVADWMNGHKRQNSPPRVSQEDRRFLRRVACQTWRYFDDLVGPQTHWLPPDNSQESLRIEVAQRTSPTNIGLGLLSVVAAHDLGFVTHDQMIGRISSCLGTMETLERYEGHLLNWYDIQSLNPLRPPYVSTVDSGNLLASLWVLEQGCQNSLLQPLIGPASLEGLADRLELLRTQLDREDLNKSVIRDNVTALVRLFQPVPKDLEEIIRRLRQAAKPAQRLSEELRSKLAVSDERVYWANKIEESVMEWLSVIDRYLQWFEMLIDLPKDIVEQIDQSVLRELRTKFSEAPSLTALVDHQQEVLIGLLKNGASDSTLTNPLQSFFQAFAKARQQAVKAVGQTEDLLRKSRRFGDSINLRFLYDPQRRLFTIGYNVSTSSRDPSYYDLLASEARLASLVAIARGEVSAEQWLALGRPYGTSNGRPVLLSWSGTMFEYLMPVLFTRTLENSLLDHACKAAVACQIEYGRQRGIPWGMSESAFSALDTNRVYQYRAFGVPGLGLKRGLEEDLVVAPYASCLALAIDPVASVRNLRVLRKLGLQAAKGFYEAIDFSRQQGPDGKQGVIIYTYMAHHQGMSLLSITNLLHDNIMQRRFHADPRVRATESLFFEGIPTAESDYHSPSPEHPISRLINPVPYPSETRRARENTRIPRARLLSNGAYTVMMTNAGGGYSRWKDFDITRWRADTTTDAWGSFCFIRDLHRQVVWSTTFHPLNRPERRYSACFGVDRIEFHRRDAGIETLMDVVVAPEDDAEIRRITLINTSAVNRHLELTSYVELALAAHNDDRIHSAFSKLFVQTEALPELNALLAWRRLRSPEDPPIWTAHLITASTPYEGELEFETNRASFLGRGHSLQEPAALNGPLRNQIGIVLDPIFSLRRCVILEPKQRVQFAFVTLAAETREGVVALVKKYQEMQAVNRAFELAWTHAQLELRYLGIQADEGHLFQDLGSHMLYPNAQLRPPPDRLRRNALGQSRLWAYGISGDLPILAVIVSDSHELGLVREALLAHTYWRVKGLKADLVILNKETTSYEQPLQNQLARLVQVYSLQTGTDCPGGVFLRSVEHIPEEDLTLILASARVLLLGSRGSLGQQLSAIGEMVELPPVFAKGTPVISEPSVPLTPQVLRYFNRLGGFTSDGREYVIQLSPGEQTPAPWINILANPQFGALITESGPGFLWYGNSQTNRQTPWLNDPVSLVVTEGVYLRDEETGATWSPTPLPMRDLEQPYRVRHGQGYTVFEHSSHGIKQEFTTFVPVNAEGGKSLRIQCLSLHNSSMRRRQLSVTTYAEWTLGNDREETQTHIVTSWDSASHTLLARNAYHPEFSKQVAFASISPHAQSYTADRAEFLGRNGSSLKPAALGRQRLSGRAGAGLDPCAALQAQIPLEPGEKVEIVYLLGQANDLDEVRSLVEMFADPRTAEQALVETRSWWGDLLGTIQVQTPDLAVDFILNRWLLYQTLSCRVWARSAFYQSGGAFGFRDQLQDVMALVYAAPNLAREHILRAAGRQFAEGDVQHWWHPSSGAGIRSRCSDDLLWLPYATAHYIRVTGDNSILEARVPFLEGRPLEEHEQEIYLVPSLGMEDGSLFEHCRRAIQKGSTQGPHGLPLIGSSDWNDGMNRVGILGRGESVWLAWFLLNVLKNFIPLCELMGDGPAVNFCQQQIEALSDAVETHAWDGEWYRRAYFDNGTPLGSKESKEAIIDSLPQSWAVISGMADKTRAEQALLSVDKMLVRKADKLILLNTPPFQDFHPHPGYVMGYPPGVRENGGQYTHAAIWVAMAFARQGDGRRAVDLLRMLNPVEHSKTPEAVSRYKGEPYVVAADVYSLKGEVGRCGWTWYTGSSGWMYRVWLEEVLGFRLQGDTLWIDPTIPPDWTEYSLKYRYQKSSYDIVVENPEKVSHGLLWVELDGERLPTHHVSLRDDSASHRVRVRLGVREEGLKGVTVGTKSTIHKLSKSLDIEESVAPQPFHWTSS